jgi:hypothetical protein
MSQQDPRLNAQREKIKAQQEQKERDRQHRAKTARQKQELQRAFSGETEDGKAFIDQLISAQDLEGGHAEALQEGTVAKIRNLLSRDWVVSNLTDAQEHEIRHRIEVLKIKVLGMHPPPESYNTGDLRAFLLDDRDAKLQPLTDEERVLIDELFETVKARITRGRGGFERELMRTNIARSETAVDEQEEQGGGSIFGGLTS